MLKKIKRARTRSNGHFAIIASKYNEVFVNSMLRAARRRLSEAGAETIEVVRVPGAFEIPVVAATLARLHIPPLSAIICLGVILRGATTHAQSIADAVSQSLANIQATWQMPIIHEVLLLENKQQAVERCLNADHNRGREAADTAIEMARVMAGLRRHE
jgi:6,7-dimethyl-8-ribityllumazine synthase